MSRKPELDPEDSVRAIGAGSEAYWWWSLTPDEHKELVASSVTYLAETSLSGFGIEEGYAEYSHLLEIAEMNATRQINWANSENGQEIRRLVYGEDIQKKRRSSIF